MAPAVLFVDDCEELRVLMEQFVPALTGVECVSVDSLASLQSQYNTLQSCDLAILDINLGIDQPSGVEVYAWLIENRFRGKMVFLTGHACSHPDVNRASQSGIRVFEKPIGYEVLVDLVNEAVDEVTPHEQGAGGRIAE